MLLLETAEFNGDHIIKLDSTLDNISRNLFTSRIFRAVKRLLLLTAILFREKPKNALIFCGHGWGFVEKGLMIFYLKLFRVESIIAPNSGLILRSIEQPIFRWFMRNVFKRAKYVICQGQYWKETFKPYVDNEEKLKIVKNWLADDAITNPPEMKSIWYTWVG